jgi:hypothetical protein
MTDEQIALAKRALACKGWRWMRGMSNDRGQTIDCVDLIQGKAYCGEWDADMTALPDLTDPATLGCLLALVREAWGDPTICTSALQLGDLPGWVVECFTQPSNIHVLAPCSTEAEALVAALEAAP